MRLFLWKNSGGRHSFLNFQNYLNFHPTLQLKFKNVSQMKDNVSEKHLCWKYPTCVAGLRVFKTYFNFLPMTNWFNLDLLYFRLISSNGQLTKNGSNGSYSNCFRIVFIQKSCCPNICLVCRLLFFAIVGQHLAFVFSGTFPNCPYEAKCLTCEISDFTPCTNAQNIILHNAEKSYD